MKLEIKRVINTSNETIGELYIDGKFECFTLEDENRDLNHDGKFESNEPKVYGDTRIPCGTYKITKREVGHIKEWLCKLWPGIVKYSLWIRDIPDFEYVLIHPGTTDKDTLGCILVGQSYSKPGIKYALSSSRLAYLALHKKVAPALDKGEEVTITLTDNK